MTHTTTVEERLSDGNYRSVVATLNITSLDNANSEDWTPATELGLNTVLGVSIEGLENAASYQAAFDHATGSLVVLAADGTDPAAGTDVGEVRVKVNGDPGE